MLGAQSPPARSYLVLREVLSQREYELFRAVAPWVRTTALHDALGVTGTAEAIGIEVNAYLTTRSPVERSVLGLFGELNVINPDSSVGLIMRDMGRLIIDDAHRAARPDQPAGRTVPSR